ncbi:MAG TPA: hypothetical protein ENN65_06745 [Candidatus Hydrogenedentes bacterium]|nr:hypothetical protein [Candidatus Hydrogenedentota bacterium]
MLGPVKDPPGPASIQIIGVDLAGNLGAALNTTALTITIEDTTGMPVGGGAVLALLSLACVLAAAASLRRKQ